jgi:zinc transporter, ZIP family
MSGWAALLWGGLSSASLYVGEALAGPMARAHRATGLVVALGAGTLLSAIAYELVPVSSLDRATGVGLAFGLGAVVYFVGDALVDRRGGRQRQSIARTLVAEATTPGDEADEADEGDEGDGAGDGGHGGAGGADSGAAMFLGALLDGLPEAFVLGIGIQLGGDVSVAFVAAVFVSNIPQGVAGTTSLLAAGYGRRRVFWMWTALSVAAALTAWLGYGLGDTIGDAGVYPQAFAAGAVLTMLADSMMPEAFRHGGKLVGLLTVLGYAVAAALTTFE